MYKVGIFILAVALPWIGVNAQTNKPAVEAAMGIWAFVSAIDVQIEQCRQIDSGNKATYDRAYVAYHQNLGGLMVKIDFLLVKEANRAGQREDFFTGQLPQLSDIATQKRSAWLPQTQGCTLKCADRFPGRRPSKKICFDRSVRSSRMT